MCTSVLSDLFHSYYQVWPDISYGVHPATQQTAGYIQSYVLDAALNLGLDLVLSDFE